MRRLHLKLFFLRTRFKREPQGVTARLLGVRPATMSHLEQGRSLPTLSMLLALCKHYDVTPTYLLDDERPIEPQSRDRWSERSSLIGRGDWVECPDGASIRTADGMWLAPVMAGARFFDSTAQAQRMLCHNKQEAASLERTLVHAESIRDGELEQLLANELMSQRKPRTKTAKRVGKAAPAQRRPGEEVPAEA